MPWHLISALSGLAWYSLSRTRARQLLARCLAPPWPLPNMKLLFIGPAQCSSAWAVKIDTRIARYVQRSGRQRRRCPSELEVSHAPSTYAFPCPAGLDLGWISLIPFFATARSLQRLHNDCIRRWRAGAAEDCHRTSIQSNATTTHHVSWIPTAAESTRVPVLSGSQLGGS